jgi:hypothetical protein
VRKDFAFGKRAHGAAKLLLFIGQREFHVTSHHGTNFAQFSAVHLYHSGRERQRASSN